MAACLLLLAGCKHNAEAPKEDVRTVDYTKVAVPAFEEDSARAYAEAQLAFGYRTPGSKGWAACCDWLAAQMRRWCDTVVVQDFKATLWDGREVPGRNIISSLRPGATPRVLLAAHWDSRQWADHDPDEGKRRSAVPGANDGASGVALLMEMARGMSQMLPSAGVDIIFFDVEDQGQPEWADGYEDNTWCKGSQHWAQHTHVPFYTAVYGMLFDMVGAAQPRFTKEEVSRHYAPGLTDKVWNVAAALGYGNIFVGQRTGAILDDHLYVNQIAGIPMVDIVQNSATTSFFPHWHTTTDNLDNLDVQTMGIVATVAMKTLYGDYPAKP